MAFGLLSTPARKITRPIRRGYEYRLAFQFTVGENQKPLKLSAYTITVKLRATAAYDSTVLATFTNDLVNGDAGWVDVYLTGPQTGGLTAAGIGGYLHATINGTETNSTDWRFAYGAIPVLEAAA